MPLKKFCNMQSCQNLVNITDRYCPDHTYIIAENEAKRQKYYDNKIRHGRDATLAAFYQSPEWEAKRAYILNKYDGIDLYAYYVHHRMVAATTVHHIHPLRTHWARRLDDINLIPVSAHSHGELERLYKSKETETQTLLINLLSRSLP